MDILASEYHQTEGGTIGIGVRSVDKLISTVMKSQRGLYTLGKKGNTERDFHAGFIGSILEYIFAPDEPVRALAMLVHSNTKIVSMTITVRGYDLDMNDPDIQYDLMKFDRPKTIFGYLVHALNMRCQNNEKTVTILSCVNIQHNGHVTKNCVLKFAKALNNLELLKYIETKLTFPSTMAKAYHKRKGKIIRTQLI